MIWFLVGFLLMTPCWQCAQGSPTSSPERLPPLPREVGGTPRSFSRLPLKNGGWKPFLLGFGNFFSYVKLQEGNMKSPKINQFSRYSSDSAKSHWNLSRHGKLPGISDICKNDRLAEHWVHRTRWTRNDMNQRTSACVIWRKKCLFDFWMAFTNASLLTMQPCRELWFLQWVSGPRMSSSWH